jgi:hypothetical protein
MVIGRILGWLLVLAAAMVLLRDLLSWYDTGVFHAIALGELWFDIHPTSLELAQPAIQRHLAPWLWDPVIVAILRWWAAPVLAVPGVLLLWVSGGSTNGRRRRRR